MITTNDTLTLFGKEYSVEWRSEVDAGVLTFRAMISTEHGELVASSTALWNALARLEMLVEWMNEEGVRKCNTPTS